MNTILIIVIISFVVVGITALSSALRGIVVSFFKLLWSCIAWIGRRIGIPSILVAVGILSLLAAIFILFLWSGYVNDNNGLLRAVLFPNFFFLLIVIMVAKWRSMAIVFMFLCTLALFTAADVVIFKAYIFYFGIYTLFCVFWIAYAIATGTTTNIAAGFLSVVMTIGVIAALYTHTEKDRWEALRDNYLAKRNIQVQNQKAETTALNNDWKPGIVRATYKIVVTNNNGLIVKPSFPIIEGGKVLVRIPQATTIPVEVDKTFKGLDVYQVSDPSFVKKEVYWIAQVNIKLSTDLSKGVVIEEKPAPNENRTTLQAINGSKKTIEILEPGDSIMCFNTGADTVDATWGQLKYIFPPNKWTSYSFGNTSPGRELKAQTRHGSSNSLTIKVFKKL